MHGQKMFKIGEKQDEVRNILFFTNMEITKYHI